MIILPPLERAAETCTATDPDPDDLIFPRTTTRLGSKYQAVIPTKDIPRDPGAWRLLSSHVAALRGNP